MDMTETIAPKSDQLNADDLLSGPRTFTIADVRPGSAEQPVDVHLAEFPAGRPWRPSKTMRRVLVVAWGAESSAYVGHRLTLYRNPDVKFGGQTVGGVYIAAMSHLPRPLVLALTETRGKKAPIRVEVLPDAAPVSRTASPQLLAELVATFVRKGIAEDTWLAGVNHYTGGAATDLEVITEEQARHMLSVLADRPDVEVAPDRSAAEHGPGGHDRIPEPGPEPEELPGGWDDVDVAKIGGQP